MQESFGALDGYLGEDSPQPEAPAAPEAPSQTPPASTPPPEKPDVDEPAPEKSKATPTAPKETPKPPAEVPVDKMAPKQLREAYGKLKGQLKELEAKIEAEKNKPPVKQDDAKLKEIEERLADREKRLQAIEEERQYADFERSDAYKRQYWEPFVSSFNEGRDLVKQLTVNADGDERQGTPEDFDRLMKISEPNQAAQYAQDMFGASAPEVLIARREVIRANNARIKAIDEFKSKGSERQKMQEQHIGSLRKAYESHRDAAVEKFPHWFKPTEGEAIDPKANELLQKGYQFVDQMFQDNQMPVDQLVKLHSVVRNKAGAFDRVAHDLRKASARVKELEAKLAEYENSEPAGGTRRSGAPNGEELNWEASLDKFASKQ